MKEDRIEVLRGHVARQNPIVDKAGMELNTLDNATTMADLVQQH